MNTKVFLVTLFAVFLSFIGGFLLANALNRSELNSLKAENERLKNSQRDDKQNDSELTLGAEEIQEKIAEADQNPNNTAFQKNLGIALYRYATVKKDTKMLDDVERLLLRANKANEKDYETIVALGNLNFDSGYFNKDSEKFEKAREFYKLALEQKPNDADIRTDYGLTYFLETPPQTEKAVVEFQKSLKENPKHEKTLQVLTQALLSQNKSKEAEQQLAKLKEVNENNPAITEFTNQLNDKKNN